MREKKTQVREKKNFTKENILFVDLRLKFFLEKNENHLINYII